MKIRPVGAELFHADKRTDERTDAHEANSHFLHFLESVQKLNVLAHMLCNILTYFLKQGITLLRAFAGISFHPALSLSVPV
jgi:hypothetical protein